MTTPDQKPNQNPNQNPNQQPGQKVPAKNEPAKDVHGKQAQSMPQASGQKSGSK